MWPRAKPPARPALWTGVEPTAPTSRFGATRDIGKQVAQVRRELARIATALWLLALIALLALLTWFAQLMAATR